MSSPSLSGSSASLSLIYLTNSILKSTEWLNELRELHYVPYNSCNSLTIYSYKYWLNENKFLVATKANNLKEFNFKTVASNDDSSLDNSEYLFSNRSSVSSNASNNPTQSTIQTEGSKNSDEKSIHNELTYLEPYVKLHQFLKIKNEGLISSIDVFEVKNFSVFVVCFALKRKPNEQSNEKYFVQIYCDFETSNLELILECCHEFELDSMPHRIANLNYVKTNETSETKSIEKFILVNCSQRINVFFSIDIKNRKFDRVTNIENYFIEFEFENIPDNCTSHDIKYLDTTSKLTRKAFSTETNQSASSYLNRRLTAIGCQNGWVGIFFIDSIKNEILKYWEQENDSFITQLHFFTTKSVFDWSQLDVEKVPVNLLVLRSLEPTRIINNILNSKKSLDDYQDIEIPHCYDLVTSAAVYDATFSGYNSIVLGTFGKVIMFFCPVPVVNNDENSSKKSKQKLKNYQKFRYEFKRDITFKHSVMGLCQSYLSNNGACDLVVLTLNGISIWQYEPDRLAELINQKYEENEQKYSDMINSKIASI